MSPAQVRALRILRSRNAGAIRVRDRWIWPVDVRGNEAVAREVVETIPREAGSDDRGPWNVEERK